MDLASAEAEIRHVFGDTPITEASIGAAPPDILVKLSAINAFPFVISEKDYSASSSVIYNLYEMNRIDSKTSATQRFKTGSGED